MRIPGWLYNFLYHFKFIRNFGLVLKAIKFAKLYGKNGKSNKNFVENKNVYHQLISVQGFSYTGSGAVTDYLKEFANVTVINNPDKESGNLDDDNFVYHNEIEVFKCPYSAMNIEKAVCGKNFAKRWFSLKMFLLVMKSFYSGGGIYNEKFWELTNEFVLKIKTQIKQHKNISICDYRKFANEYFTNFLKAIPSKEFLVLDQALATHTSETEKKLDYIGDVKMICVYRDVRDVFASAVIDDDFTPPHDTVKAFINWYKMRGKMIDSYMNDKNPNKLMINFSDLVLNYDETTKKINDFLKFFENDHINKGKCFVPEISKKNVGLYKTLPNQKDVKYIESQLLSYCYDYKYTLGGG